MSGHSTTTCVITSRIQIADVARLHQAAERCGSTVSALVAELVHEGAPKLERSDASESTDALAA